MPWPSDSCRSIPGLQVARIDANKWVVSARGFAEQFANKLLVLIDGRTVYTPLFSGVLWDVQDVMLEDFDVPLLNRATRVKVRDVERMAALVGCEYHR